MTVDTTKSDSVRDQHDEGEPDMGRELERPAKSPTPRAVTLPSWAPWAVLGASAAAVALVALATSRNVVLFALGTAVLFVVATYVLARVVEGSRKATDRLVTLVVGGAFLVAIIPLVSLVYTVVTEGSARIFDLIFYTSSMRGVIGEGGGIYHALFGTLIITGLATVMSVPVGLLTAIYLVEYGRGRLAKVITFFVDVMTGIPSIVAGLFAYALFVLVFGPGVRMGLAGAVALSVLMVPVVVRSTEEMLRVVPNSLREAAFALGVPRWRTILKVVIPTAVSGIASGVTLAIARVMGETAPLLVTVGITTSTNFNPFEGRMATLPVFAYYQYVAPGLDKQAFLDRAWATALLLIVIVMSLNLFARFIARVFAPKFR